MDCTSREAGAFTCKFNGVDHTNWEFSQFQLLILNRPCVISFVLFSLTLFIFSHLSTPNSSIPVFIITCFANGLCTGAALNYTLSHLLFLTLPEDHFIVTGLIATFRGFAGSFGSAIGSGIFLRVLKSSLEAGFNDRHMKGEEDLVRRLLGSPALVRTLEGAEKDVAVTSYVTALQSLFIAASGLALLMILFQAATGWNAPEQLESEDEEEESLSEEEEQERARLVD